MNSGFTLEDYTRILNQYQELQQENLQLKERIKQLDNGFMACVEEKCEIAEENARLKNDNALMKVGLIQISDKQLDLYKLVSDEIREYIKEHNDYLEKAKEMYISCNDELLKSTCIQLINNELVRSDNLLQILDKVKGVNK